MGDDTRVTGSNLGLLVRVHRQSFVHRFGLPVACVAVLAGELGLFVWIYLLAPTAFAGEPSGKEQFLLIAAPVVCAGLLVAWFKSRGRTVALHEDGLATTDGMGTKSVRWDEVAAVWRSIFEGPFPSGSAAPERGYLLIMHDGRRIALPGTLAGAVRLGSHVEQQVAARVMPEALARFAAGEALEFGAYILSRDEIAVRTASMTTLMLGNFSAADLDELEHTPWSAITRVELDANFIRLKRVRGQDIYIGWNGAPNVPVLLRLLQGATGQALT